jgi:hypothetical protein
VLAHASRQPLPWLISNVRQNVIRQKVSECDIAIHYSKGRRVGFIDDSARSAEQSNVES